jgi:hypothetical protein
MESKNVTMFPSIKRARDYYLYDFNNIRYLDLYQNNGRALMGHRPEKVARELKNVLSRGLLANYPSVYEQRLAKALSALFPDYQEFRFYNSQHKARAAAAAHLGADPALQPDHPEAADLPHPADPALGDVKGEGLALWRPFLGVQTMRIPVLIPILPFPAETGITVCCFLDRAGGDVPASDRLSPVLASALVRTVYSFLGFRQRIDRAAWPRFECELWHRKGPYLIARCKPEEYATLFARLLERKTLICPHYPGPSIVPGSWNEGDISWIKEAGEVLA